MACNIYITMGHFSHSFSWLFEAARAQSSTLGCIRLVVKFEILEMIRDAMMLQKLLVEVTAFQSTIDKLVSGKLRMLGPAAAAVEDDRDVNSKLNSEFVLRGCCYDNNKTVVTYFAGIDTG